MDELATSRWQETALAAWPSIALPREIYADFLRERGGVAREAFAADLYLACACLHGIRGASAVFEVVLKEAVSRPVFRVDPNPAFLDDVRQVLRERLLVSTPTRRAGLAEYEGRAALRTWLATAGARAALNLRRAARDRHHEELASTLTAAASGVGLEIDYAKEEHRRAFHAAVRASLDALTERDREALVLHLVDGVTLDALAERYGRGRATVARWLAGARQKLSEETRRELCRRLGVPETSYPSVAAFVRSSLGESVVELLKGRAR